MKKYKYNTFVTVFIIIITIQLIKDWRDFILGFTGN
jgi:hypothetical protein